MLKIRIVETEDGLAKDVTIESGKVNPVEIVKKESQTLLQRGEGVYQIISEEEKLVALINTWSVTQQDKAQIYANRNMTMDLFAFIVSLVSIMEELQKFNQKPDCGIVSSVQVFYWFKDRLARKQVKAEEESGDLYFPDYELLLDLAFFNYFVPKTREGIFRQMKAKGSKIFIEGKLGAFFDGI